MRDKRDIIITMYTVYEKPLDFPDEFVVREWLLVKDGHAPTEPQPGEIVFRGPTYGSVCDFRELNHPDLAVLTKTPWDEPQVVETWI